MESNIATTLFEEARSKNELARYFGGYPEYSITDVYADMPTDFGAAFTPIRMRLKNEPELGPLVKDALIQLSEDPEYGWTALEGLIQLCLIRNYQGIDLLDSAFLDIIAQNLQSNRNRLMACKKWHGAKLEHGVWSLALSSNDTLRKDYNITVLPEEL